MKPTPGGRSSLALLLTCAIGCGRPADGPVQLPVVIGPAKLSTLDRDPQPRTLDEALIALDRGASGIVILKMRQGDESVVVELHDGLGLWMRNSWGLYERGPLYSDLAKLGLQYPDDMSALILTSWWRRMHDRPLNLAQQVLDVQEFYRRNPPPPPPPRPPKNRRTAG